MQDREPAQRKHRGSKRHGYKKWRLLALFGGVLCVVTGLAFSVWASSEGGDTPRRFAWFYFAIGGGALAVYALLSGMHRAGLTRGTVVRADESSRRGMALLMALLLTALLSGAVLHALVSAHMTLRASVHQRSGALLRIAATDAAREAFGKVAEGGGGGAIQERVTEARLPSGIATTTTVRPLDRAAVPAILANPKSPLFGAHFAVVSAAREGTRTWELQSVGCRLPSGEVRILCWIEPL